jgi:hypothetical protein
VAYGTPARRRRRDDERPDGAPPSLEVDTPVQNGYTRVRAHHVSFEGAQAMEIVAFSDKDNDGGSRDPVVPIARHSPVSTQSTRGEK